MQNLMQQLLGCSLVMFVSHKCAESSDICSLYSKYKSNIQFSLRQYDVHAECDIRFPIPSVRPFADLSVQYQYSV